MAEFLIETYAPRETANAVAMQVDEITRAAEQVSEQGTEVRFLLAIFVPEEESCFYLYQSPSADAVREAATCAGLPFDWINEAISIVQTGHRLAMARGHASPPKQRTITITRPEET
jgi:hypothetical protein